MRLLLLLLLTCQPVAAGPLGDRLSIRADAGYAVSVDGYTRIRQFNAQGDRLDLHEDLGVDNWAAVSLEAAWRFDRVHAVSAAFTLNRLRGESSLNRDVTHEGAVYAAGTELSFDRTSWWRLETWYHFTPWRTDYAALTLLGGALMDFVDVYVVADPGPTSGKRDDHENFGTLAMPLPTLGLRLELQPVTAFMIALDARGTYMPEIDTWYGDDGGTRHTQTAFEAGLELSYRVALVDFGVAVQHNLLHIEQNNSEDGNEFSLRGTFAQAFIRVWL